MKTLSGIAAVNMEHHALSGIAAVNMQHRRCQHEKHLAALPLMPRGRHSAAMLEDGQCWAWGCHSRCSVRVAATNLIYACNPLHMKRT